MENYKGFSREQLLAEDEIGAGAPARPFGVTEAYNDLADSMGLALGMLEPLLRETETVALMEPVAAHVRALALSAAEGALALEMDGDKAQIDVQPIYEQVEAILAMAGEMVPDRGMPVLAMADHPIAMIAGNTPAIIMTSLNGSLPPVTPDEIFELIRILMSEIGQMMRTSGISPRDREFLRRMWEYLNQLRNQLGRLPAPQVLAMLLQYLFLQCRSAVSGLSAVMRGRVLQMLMQFARHVMGLMGMEGLAGGAAASGGSAAGATVGGMTATALAIILAKMLAALGIGMLVGWGLRHVPIGGGRTFGDWVDDTVYDLFYSGGETCSDALDSYFRWRYRRRDAEEAGAAGKTLAVFVLHEYDALKQVLDKKCVTGVQKTRLEAELERLGEQARRLMQ